MATIVACNQCGRALEPTERQTLELRTVAYSSPELVDEIDACAQCAGEIRARFLSSPGIDRLRTAAQGPVGLIRRDG